MRAVDLAALFGVTKETISRWENGKTPIDKAALAALGALVVDESNGRTDTLDRLRALADPPHLPAVVQIES